MISLIVLIVLTVTFLIGDASMIKKTKFIKGNFTTNEVEFIIMMIITIMLIASTVKCLSCLIW